VNNAGASELLLDLQLRPDKFLRTFPDDVSDRPGREAEAEQISHGLTGALVRQQLVLLKVEHPSLHSRSVLHDRADCYRELPLRRLLTLSAAQKSEPVLGHFQLRRHHLKDLLPEVMHNLSGG
jgi:hypothetical protein